ncbi:aldo/keto reductase [Acidisoma cellulosilytica]|uniref:Aldo/keto reductase n=1 Tax=Acidisoma cellulosilyticum TaxID=2802395 RepID=A0A963Z2L0_9PROT|nr:aldo/keto reductase [Acidisoma cellulosilyticum]MCB8881466.1 aldo/keto reductase [Acidisoma cellulosilyticum]
MRYKKFGGTGLQVSELCLGTMTFGLQCDETQSRAILNAASEGGIDFLDLANVYPLGGGKAMAGRTEEIVGSWLDGRRQDFIIATKCAGEMGAKPWQRGMSRKSILDAIDASLRRLRTDYIDLYQLHRFDPLTPLDETLEALDSVVRAGKARYVGVSNWQAIRVARALGRSEVKNLVSIDSVQPRYNLLFRAFERDLLPLCEEEDVAVIPYNPLAGGLLTGKHNPGEAPPEGGRFKLGEAGSRYQDRYWHERSFETVERLRVVAREAGLTLATMAMRWVMSNPAVTAPIIGASRPEQLADSFAAAEQGPLEADLKAKLDEMTFEWRAVEAER